jgi:hypothetical protein
MLNAEFQPLSHIINAALESARGDAAMDVTANWQNQSFNFVIMGLHNHAYSQALTALGLQGGATRDNHSSVLFREWNVLQSLVPTTLFIMIISTKGSFINDVRSEGEG